MEKLLEEIRDWGDGYPIMFMIAPAILTVVMVIVAIGGAAAHGFVWWVVPIFITVTYYLFALTTLLGYSLYLGDSKHKYLSPHKAKFNYWSGTTVVVGFVLVFISGLLCSWAAHWIFGLVITLCTGIVTAFILARVFKVEEEET